MGAKERYESSMKNFCKTEFGTDDLDKCRLEMRNEYRGVW